MEAEVAVGVAQSAPHERRRGLGLRGDALGQRLLARILVGVGGQRGLAGEEVLDGGGEALPVRLGHTLLEAGGEIGEDELADLVRAEPLGVNQAVGDAAGGTLGASCDAANEHGPRIAWGAPDVNQ